jgi:DNA repair exonuclease SbcCD nuclease subunit
MSEDQIHMRFVHTADWQIGMKAVHLGEKAETARRARFQSARRIIEIVREQRADFVLLAGDTFEHHGIERAKVREIANLLSTAPCPVYIIPGNHDPAGNGSVWEDECWSRSPNVRVVLAAEPIDAPGATLYPCPALNRTSATDPTAWIARQNSKGIRIAIAHGSVIGHPEMGDGYPIPNDAACRLGLDYLALGHYHSTAYYPGADGAVRIAYCGTHEPTSFQERDSGNILVVEIAGPGDPPVIQKLRTRLLDWQGYVEQIQGRADLAKLKGELEAIPSPEQTLVQCALSGIADGIDDEAVEDIREIVESRFLYGSFDRRALRIEGNGDEWIDSLPPGYLQETARQLRAEAQFEVPDETASRALGEFRRMWREVRV